MQGEIDVEAGHGVGRSMPSDGGTAVCRSSPSGHHAAMDQLRAMRAFATVIEAGSFNGAATAMGLSPAAVTRLVAELEDQLGARLINRTTRRLALTEVGETYLDKVRQILIDIEEAEALAGNAVREPRGLVRVLSPPAFAVHQIARHLPLFRERYPQVSLELTVPGPVEHVDETQDVTILMVGTAPLKGDFIARRLARTELILCASPDYIARRGLPDRPEDLKGHAALLPSGGQRPRELVFRSKDGEVRIVPGRAALHTHHVDTHYAAALAGMGVAGLPSFVASEALLKGRLVRLLPQWTVFTAMLYAALPTRKHIPARTRAFVDFFVEMLGGEDRDPWLQAAGCETELPASTIEHPRGRPASS